MPKSAKTQAFTEQEAGRVTYVLSKIDREDFQNAAWNAAQNPLHALDILATRNQTGDSPIDSLLMWTVPAALAEGLRRHLEYTQGTPRSKAPTYTECLQAVNQKRAEQRQIEVAVNGKCEVYCTKCRQSTYSDYHNYLCGDEETEGFAYAAMQLAMDSDDPDAILDMVTPPNDGVLHPTWEEAMQSQREYMAAVARGDISDQE